MRFLAEFFYTLWPALVVVAGAGPVVWFATEFLARPIRHFFDLRQEAKQLTLRLWDAPAYGYQSREEWKAQMAAFKDRRERLSDLGAEIFSFAQSERFAVWSVRVLGYDPAEAGRAAKKIAFELGTNIEDRDRNYKALDTALKYRFDAKHSFYDPYGRDR
jgi:hypothetical protein